MLFDRLQNHYFNSYTGAYSVLTEREFRDSQLTLTGDEYRLANYFFGGRIHCGPVRDDPGGALKTFHLYPEGRKIELNLVYPKQEKEELRLYLSQQRGFKPRPGAMWFIFEREAELFVGSMTTAEWRHHFGISDQQPTLK